jgi:DNA adenine methylase
LKATGFSQPSLWGAEFDRGASAKPILRWAGGKSRFLQLYGKLIPEFTGKYLEPFFGGGAVFFHLCRTQRRPFVTRIGDTNVHLIRTLQEIRSNPEMLSARLQELQARYSSSSERAGYYYEIRDAFNDRLPRTNVAQFIFLNRTCWNGLWRVNQRGQFNVPYGAPKTEVVVPQLDEISNASAALQRTFIRATSWQNTLAFAESGDFVFLDPPYYSDLVSIDGSGRAKYTVREFTAQEHRELARSVANLRDRGISFMLTNSAEPEMVELYSELKLKIRVTQIPRWINSDTDARHSISELLVTP